MNEVTEAYLGLGSNLGNKVGNIRKAIKLLSGLECIQKVELSSFYRTAPVGVEDQDWFVNAVARVGVTCDAQTLLKFCLGIERELKRVRLQKWGPRTLDIDILFFGNERVSIDQLEIPHPRMKERAFVLQPLSELAPDALLEGKPVTQWLPSVESQEVVRMSELVAVIGASEKPERYAYQAQSLLQEKGFRVAPVSPKGGKILREAVYDSLCECQEPVDTVTLYVGSARVASLLPDLLAVRPRRVVFNPGTENLQLKTALEQEGIQTLEACTLVLLRTGQW